MTGVAASNTSSLTTLVDRAIGLLDAVPYTLLALPLRVGAAAVFWNSSQAKLANWDTTIELFTEDYKVPLLPPDIAANMALSIELITPVLLVLGLLTRAAALVLLGMTAVIEIFVFPLAWPTHIQWAAMLLMLLPRARKALPRSCVVAAPAPLVRRGCSGVTTGVTRCSCRRQSPVRLAGTAARKRCPRMHAGTSMTARVAE
jgi:putative oxidoreductase